MDVHPPTPNMDSVAKAELRRKIQLLLRAGRADWKRLSQGLIERLRQQTFWEQARTVALFAPLPDEPDLLELMSNDSKRFVFPRMATHGLSWHQAHSEAALRPVGGQRMLREPVEIQEVRAGEIDLMIVPGVAFTLSGARLGRGGGYYDRALTELSQGTVSVGVCFECQILPALPMEAHDQAVSRVIWA